MMHATMWALVQARLAELRHQAQRAAQARAAQARAAQARAALARPGLADAGPARAAGPAGRQRAPGVRATLTSVAHRPLPGPKNF
jgi:hypothetical protein